jgi:hypothetical protein
MNATSDELDLDLIVALPQPLHSPLWRVDLMACGMIWKGEEYFTEYRKAVDYRNSEEWKAACRDLRCSLSDSGHPSAC